MRALAVAHRAGNFPTGLDAATRMGVDVIECDVHAHHGHVEVRHLRTAGPIPLLGERRMVVPSAYPRLDLEEVLEAGRRGAVLMLDLKGRREAVGTGVVDVLRGTAPGPVLVCGRAWRSVEHVADQLPFVLPVLSARTGLELAVLRHRIAAAERPAPYGVCVHTSLLDPAVVDELRASVEVVMAWPVNDESMLRDMLRIGVNAVVSDEPQVLRTVLRG